MIALIRASGSISRIEGPLSVSGSGIVGEKFIEKIRSVRGKFDLTSLTSLKFNTGGKVKFMLDNERFLGYITLIMEVAIYVSLKFTYLAELHNLYKMDVKQIFPFLYYKTSFRSIVSSLRLEA